MTPEQREQRRIYMADRRQRPELLQRERELQRIRRAAQTPEERAHKSEQRRLWTQRRREAGVHTVTLLPREEYDRALRSQRGLCAICRQPEVSKSAKGRVRRLAIDHDHTSGRIRALLCSRCNTAIALCREDAGILEAAAEYVRRQWLLEAAHRMQQAVG